MERFVTELGLQARSRIVAWCQIRAMNHFDSSHFHDQKIG